MGAAYCTSDDLLVPSALLATVSGGDITAAIEEASRICDSYLVVRYELPIAPLTVGPPAVYTADLSEACAAIATYRMLRKRGFNADGKQSSSIKAAYDDAKKWLADVAQQNADLLMLDAKGAGESTAGSGGQPNRVLQAYPSEAMDGTLSSVFFTNPTTQNIDEEAIQTVGVPKRRGW